jgi:hypothetical protein
MLMLFMIIMLGAPGISLIAGWVVWQRQETALVRRGVREAELELYAKVRELQSSRSE